MLKVNRSQWITGICLLVLTGLSAYVYAPCMDSQLAGFLHDDGVYLMSGQMLANGKGFILPNLADSTFPAEIKYPIVYPLILSLGWKLDPSFPQNLPLMHWLTSLFGILTLPLLYLYLRQIKSLDRWNSGLITFLTGSSFFYIFYTTSIMSEAPYFFLSLLTLFLAEKWLPSSMLKSIRPWQLGLLVLLSVLVFHTRTVGVTLIGAISLWLFIYKQWRNLLFYSISALLTSVLPWLLWVKLHAPKVTDLNYPIAFLYGGYGVEFGIHAPNQFFHYIEALFSQGFYPLMENTLQTLFPALPYLLGSVWPNTVLLLLCIYTVNGLLLLPLIRSIREKHWSISGLYVSCYLTLIALWLYPNQAARFLMVIQPWLWLALFKMRIDFKRPSLLKNVIFEKIAITLSLFILTIWPAFQGYQLLKHMRQNHQVTPSPGYASLAKDYQEVFNYIQKNTPKTARIASVWDPLFYLYTKRKTFPIFSAALQPDQDGRIAKSAFTRLDKSLIHYQVDYVVDEPFMISQQVVEATNPVVSGLRHFYPDSFELVFETTSKKIKVYHRKQAQQ